MAYTGTFYRGVDYSPTWVSFVPGAQGTQVVDSDFFNDAFASLWANTYQSVPNSYPSQPVDNTNAGGYRGDLNTIASEGFNLVRLYNWDMARGTTAMSKNGLDHLNFLNYAHGSQPGALGLKIVVPVSNYFLSDGEWNNQTPASGYAFNTASPAIQRDFQQFINSITDPTTGKIHAAVHSIAVGNEGDHGTGLTASPSNFLARTNWWIYNLNQTINGASGSNNGTTVPLTATFSNGDQGGTSTQGGWFNDLVNGVLANQSTPNGTQIGSSFASAVQGLSAADSSYANYYYNSMNFDQVVMSGPHYLQNGLANTLGLYDSGGGTGSSQWPFAKFTVPLLMMEVATPNRGQFQQPSDQATAAQNNASAIEGYRTTNISTTNLMGYNYFEFSDENAPSANNLVGLWQQPATWQYVIGPGEGNNSFGLWQQPATDATANAQTGTTSTFYGGFGNYFFPVDPLTATPGPTAPSQYSTLWQAWTGQFAPGYQGTAGNDKLVGTSTAESFRGGAGNDSIDGANGYDIALYGQNARAYTLKATAGSAAMTVQAKLGTEGTDTLTNVEQVRFTDGTIDPIWILHTAAMPVAQILKVVDLYTAGLNRAPDALGLDYYVSKLADGASLGAISKAIFSSAEAAPIYSAANSNPVFVTLAYQNALGRAPDAAGQAFWTNELNTGHIARTDFVTALIAGATGTDKQYIANKEAVGAHFALTQGLKSLDWAQFVGSGVTAFADTVKAANAQTDAFAAIAAAPATAELVVQIVGLVP